MWKQAAGCYGNGMMYRMTYPGSIHRRVILNPTGREREMNVPKKQVSGNRGIKLGVAGLGLRVAGCELMVASLELRVFG
jgi:hypothetical protein